MEYSYNQGYIIPILWEKFISLQGSTREMKWAVSSYHTPLKLIKDLID